MKVIHLHQRYRIRGGEDQVVDATVDLLRRRGVETVLVTRDSASLAQGLTAKIGAFFSGVYSFSAAGEMRRLLAAERPDLVHVHNLHPLFSPSILLACRAAATPVVMTCHNYRLVCPTGMHMREGRICELCLGGREHWCLLKNCRGDWAESAAYAVRNAVHRKLGLYRNHVHRFIAVSSFVRDRLVAAGLPAERMAVIPNWVAPPPETADCRQGRYAAFAGRFSPQKGIATLLAAAASSGVPLRLAGDASAMPEAVRTAPPNAEFMGRLGPEAMAAFYRQARFAVAPSECLEPFGLVAIEAMSHGLPVICSRIGGLAEIVEDGVTGLLFTPGDSGELAEKMRLLWNNPELCRQLGQAGCQRVLQEFNEDRYFQQLMSVYHSAAGLAEPSATPVTLGGVHP